MITGHGDLASALTDRFDRHYFASGVSDSQCNDWKEFNREQQLLMAQKKTDHLVYFSSLSIFYADTPYTRHKIRMEALVRQNFNTYTIIRVGNITWGTNPNTFINYLKNRITAGLKYEVKNEWRYICDREEFDHWIKMIPDFNCEMNITGSRKKPHEIVRQIESTLQL